MEMMSSICALRKKTGRKINSPPGLKFGIVTPKDFPKSLIKRRASMPLSFLRFSFCCFLSFLSHRLLIPPFHSVFAEVREELGMTSLNDEVITRFFLSNVFRKHFRISLRARARQLSSELVKFSLFRRRETKL